MSITDVATSALEIISALWVVSLAADFFLGVDLFWWLRRSQKRK